MATTPGSTTPYPGSTTTGSTTGGFNGGEGTLNRTSTGAHNAIDASASGAQNLANKAKPMIDKVASSAHQAVDKAVNVAVPTAEWLSTQGENLKVKQEQVLEDTRQYVVANPIKAIGIALGAGLLLGRLMR